MAASDREWFDENALYQVYAAVAACLRVGGRRRQELIEEVFARVLQRLVKLRADKPELVSSLDTMVGTARYLSRKELANCFKQHYRSHAMQALSAAQEDTIAAAADDDPALIAERRQQQDWLRAAMARLAQENPKRAQALHLHQQGRTYEQIAGEMQTNVSMAYRLTKEAMERLAEWASALK